MRLYLNPAAICLILFIGINPIYAQQKVVYRTALNRQFKPLPNERYASAIEERWLEKGVWKAKLINNETGRVIAEYGYVDSTRNTKHGLYIESLALRCFIN